MTNNLKNKIKIRYGKHIVFIILPPTIITLAILMVILYSDFFILTEKSSNFKLTKFHKINEPTVLVYFSSNIHLTYKLLHYF